MGYVVPPMPPLPKQPAPKMPGGLTLIEQEEWKKTNLSKTEAR